MTREDFELTLLILGFTRSDVLKEYWIHPKVELGIDKFSVDIEHGTTYIGVHRYGNALAELRRTIAGNLEEGSEQWKSQKNSTMHIPVPK